MSLSVQIEELEDENEALENKCSELETQIAQLEDQIEELKTWEEDVDMLCARLGITRHEWELERGHIRNQLLK